MGFKNFIAAFLILLFLGKIVSIDAKFIGVILEASEVTLVNKMCLKQQLTEGSHSEFTHADITSHVELDYLCHVSFDFRPEEEFKTLTAKHFKENSYHPPEIFPISRDKFYPPPKV
ncbi:hypothetical protein JRG66_13485 [Salinimicrobium tongyeongense]|uniref:Uncharacterized protein n=1 Tax=Salinimicrobium tongyeongense TaxID=2809707 RepID=A0ABY6NPZ2_9FLAO|nr:hypothetical protein [Salinimicrobium tongyeongense]UZH54962.1 hypothetical protein JRG66_13485 [Salinimicrobium tongyeongense]